MNERDIALVQAGIDAAKAALCDDVGVFDKVDPAAIAATVPQEQGAALKMVRGELCYRSEADDQSFGMWCPVSSSTELSHADGTELYTNPAPVNQQMLESLKLPEARVHADEDNAHVECYTNGWNSCLYAVRQAIAAAEGKKHD